MKRVLFFALTLLSAVSFAYSQQASPATALYDYIHNGDDTKAWEVRDTYEINGTKTYSLLLVSQKWKGMLWRHELTVHVPDEIDHEGALLFIDGGRLQDGIPAFTGRDNNILQMMSAVAEENNAVVAILRQVPNQPLYGGLNEDALISYTLGEFRKDGDYSWPLLFPMAKSAVRAMDCLQEFAKEEFGGEITGFVISGASKRGWTTWLTGASRDPRVLAIAPMVIDMLNMPVSLDYQRSIYGEYSEEIEDYVKLDIPQAIRSDFGKAVVRMIDPYSYRKDLTMPKMIFMGTNDPYWTVDAVKHYLDSIPGTNLLHYVANAGHGLGDRSQAIGALSSFFGLTISGESYPEFSWTLTENSGRAELAVRFSRGGFVGARLWTASSQTRDFRKSEWTATAVRPEPAESVLDVGVEYPKAGFRAFYADLIYRNATGGEYSVSTRVYVMDPKQVFVD